MILNPGEKIHVIHRRHFEKEPRRHFAGTVEAYEGGVARVIGYVYAVDGAQFAFKRRPEKRVRLISVIAGDLLINVLPASVDLEKIVYKSEKHGVRVTDGSDWYLNLSEFTWA